MAILYLSENLRAISCCFQSVRFDPKLWRCLCTLGISRTKLTRRCCRAGVKKQKPPEPSEAPLQPTTMASNDLFSRMPQFEQDFILPTQDSWHLQISSHGRQ